MSTRWATLIICSASSGLDPSFQQAVDFAASAISSLGNPQLDQCVARLYSPSLPTFTDYAAAVSWLQPFMTNLNYFVASGGQNVVLFNELNINSEPQYSIDPRTIALIAAAIRDTYTAPDSTRSLYLLFPGRGGAALSTASQWNSYWDTYDLRDAATHTPMTFDQYYGSGNVDPRLDGSTMLYHGGSGIFDRVALHCYAADPTSFSLDDPVNNPALQVIQWYLNPPPASGAAVVDTTGWCYVTECGGQCGTANSACFGDSGQAGSALATFQARANARYTQGNAFGNPALLQEIYGYILDYSNNDANTNGRYEIGNGNPGKIQSLTQLTSAYLTSYNAARSFP